jgi:arylsulfatase A-like enzyme
MRPGRSSGAALAALALASAACSAPAAPPPVRSVIVVDVDTLRADRLSSYGNPRPTSPRLDAFAAAGTRFEWAFAQAPYTLPSQVSILTGLYPQSHGVLRETDRMSAEANTLAERFRAAGWRTGAFVDGGYVSAPFGFDQGFETFVDHDRGGLARSEAAISAWLGERAAEPDARLFLFVHTYDPHTPYAPPEPFRTRFASEVAPPTAGFEPTTEALEAIRASQWTPPQRRLEPRDLDYARALYDGEVAFVDAWFGRLLARLDELGLGADSVVTVISDHGEEFQEHGSLLHEKLYATVTRIPWLLRAPGGAAGRVVAGPVESVDLVPTLLELAGLPSAPDVDGRSLAAAVRGGELPPARLGLGLSPFWGEQRMAFDERHHLLLTVGSARAELFRYRDDPDERRDLAAAEPETVERLARAYRARLGELPGRGAGRAPIVAPTAVLPPETEAALRALGYLR